jgi:hypothetical protein
MEDLASLLGCAHATEKEITKAILSVNGINSVLSSLTKEERGILNSVYTEGGDGINLGGLAKQLDIGIPAIEKAANSLSNKLMVHVIMNRQLLTNKLDKVYAIEEIAICLNLEDMNMGEKLRKLRTSLEQKKSGAELKHTDPVSGKILRFLTENGGIVFFNQIAPLLNGGDPGAAVEKAAGDALFYIHYSLLPDFNSYVIINEKLLPVMAAQQDAAVRSAAVAGKSATGASIDVHNGYRFIINMMHAYDSISSYGLFLTKQMVFRKIDYSRIVNSMIRITGRNGAAADSAKICAMALFFLSALKCLRINKDSAGVNISPLREGLENPHILASQMLNALDSAKNSALFQPPHPLPPYKMTVLIIKILHSASGMDYNYLKILLLAAIIDADKKKLPETIANIAAKKEEIDAGLDLLCMLGLIEIKDGNYLLSDAGYDTAEQLFKLKAADEEQPEPEKNIYLNPDFSLMVPLTEVSSACAFRIMAWSEIIKDDIILNTQISRSSIVTAQKRGLSPELFIKTLRDHSKNPIPKNMEFQLNEWSKQTLKITITNSVLIKSSRADFFDEIMYVKNLADSIEVIGTGYAIVHRKYLDDIIKVAAKHNAVISLFEENGEE